MTITSFTLRMAVLSAAGLGALVSVRGGAVPAAEENTVAHSAVSVEQVAAGRAAYQQSCALCHGADLRGGNAPSLMGPDILGTYSTVGGLYDLVAASMPPQSPAGLPAEEYAAIVAYILVQNGACAGDHALMSDPEADRDLRLAALASGCASGGGPNDPARSPTKDVGAVPQAYTWGKALPSVGDPQ